MYTRPRIRIGTLFIFAGILLVTVGCLSAYSIRLLVNELEDERQSHRQIAILDTFLARSHRAQSLEHRWLASGRNRDLEEFVVAAGSLPSSVADLRTSFQTTPADRANFKAISDATERLRSEADLFIETRSTRPSTGGESSALDERIEELMTLVREVRSRESERLVDGSAAAEGHARRAFGIILVAIATTLITLATSATVITRVARARFSASKSLKLANEELQLLVTEQRQRTRENELMSDMSELLQICQALQETVPIVASHGAQLFPSTSGDVYLGGGPQHEVDPIASWGVSDRAVQDGISTTDCWAIRSGRIHRFGPGRAGLSCAHVPSTGGYSLCVPMQAHGELIGLLSISAANSSLLDGTNEQLAKTLGETLSLSFSNIRLRESLRLRAARDPLTGIYNRRYMEEALRRELRRASRKSSPLAIAMIDVDYFKLFNDKHGHAAGDEVLRQLAGLMQHLFRQEDVVCRFGGEEFALILVDTMREAAVQRLEDFRESARSMLVEVDGIPLGQVTVSIGVALSPVHGTTPEVLVAAADRALYRAKAAGRDTVVVAPELEIVPSSDRAERTRNSAISGVF